MSGIAGHWGYAAHDLARETFARFTHALAHRGPEGFGIEHFPETHLWLGHRQLASFDRVDRATQPISYGDGRYWLAYDGEIYNHPELREDLRGLGHRLATDADGEVVAAAYAQWGSDCLLRFNGAWAFSLWDAHERRLVLARDRFGAKPLFYSTRGGALTFASELKAFLALPWIDGGFDPDALAQILIDIPAQESIADTLLPGVRRLLAGHYVIAESGGRIRAQKWWNSLDHLPRLPADFPSQVEAFRSLLFDACRLRLRGAGALAVEQSGGLDSSAIACSVARLAGEDHDASSVRFRAFIARLVGTPYDEGKRARLVADHIGIPACEACIDDRSALENIEQLIFDHEIIFTLPRIGPWSLYRAIRGAGFHVSLNGNGADDLLGSDPDDLEADLRAAAARFDLRRCRELREVLGRLDDGTPSDRLSIPRAMRRSVLRELRRLGLLRPVWTGLARGRATAAALRRFAALGGSPNLRPGGSLVRQAWPRAEPPDPRFASMPRQQARHIAEFHVANALYLANFDRSSMAHSVQLRMPFMDWRLVTFALALPEASRNGGGYTKRILRCTTQGSMPDPIRLGTAKLGFVSPLDHWARASLKPWILDLCASRSFLESSVWNGPMAKAKVERFMAGCGTLRDVWPLLQAHVLAERFGARARALIPRREPFGGSVRSTAPQIVGVAGSPDHALALPGGKPVACRD
ncbi:MAG TPA: asparagine synthase (glutamine-hydrolyzing) [Stellaceae bacterium]|nr:asparagine synthase (glutamine-hydrolyzing) [Stellaceae bacterium]